MQNQRHKHQPIKGSVGFFISSEGMLFRIEGGNHISTVIRNFSKFGLTLLEIHRLYEFFGERVGVEGVAWKQILTRLIQQGWIRLRRYPNKYWSANIPRLTAQVGDILQDWATKFLFGLAGFREPDPHMPVVITGRLGKLNRSSIKEISEGALISLIEKGTGKTGLEVRFLESAALLPDIPPLDDSENALEPQVGIFFLVEGELIVQSVPFSKGEEDVDFVNDPRGHEKSWTLVALELEGKRCKPFTNKSYDYYPRGRCLYSKKASRFLLYLDPCMLHTPLMLEEIMCRLQIPAAKTDVVSDDPHYRCSGCNPRYVPDTLVDL